jgi:hypothetical protein
LTTVLQIASEVAHPPPLLIALIGLARLYSMQVSGEDQATERWLERSQLARSSLQAVIEHPSCWYPYRIRAQRLAQDLAAHVGRAGSTSIRAVNLAEVVAAWQALAE